MESSPRRRCPQCGMPVAQRAENCLMCGALLRERTRREIKLPITDLALPVLLILAVVAVWLWKPWQQRPVQTLSATFSTPTATPSPIPAETQAVFVAATATPLDTPVPTPTPTLPPNQTTHTVQSGETISTIAKSYGTTINAVLQANGLKGNSIIKPGMNLKIPLPVADIPTPTPTVLPSPTPVTYVVKAGDTLSTIATKFSTTVAALMAANNIVDATRMHVGARLRIVRPDEITPTPTAMTTQVYTVKSGDTLFDIAIKFKVSVADLKRANNLKSDMLHVGQKLTIPAGPGGTVPEPSPTPQPVAEATAEPTETPAAEGVAGGTLSVTDSVTNSLAASTLLAPSTPALQADGPAADLLAPADGAVFEGRDAVILLIWASVGILDDDEWYVVRLRRGDMDESEVLLFWTRVTSFRVPADLYVRAGANAQRWRWRVLVMRHTGQADDGSWVGEELRPASTNRAFYWK